MSVADKITLVGVIQEQHPERCELFAQWQKFDWPILHDPINLLGATVVPMVIAIDENGVVRNTRTRSSFVEKFVEQEFAASEEKDHDSGPDRVVSNQTDDLIARAKSEPTMDRWVAAGDSTLLWQNDPNAAIEFYTNALKLLAKDSTLALAAIRFRLGVAYQMRNESDRRLPGDFSRAVNQWSAALELYPNQYIWRRRLQQYGPRLDKPYPFYDWVEKARAEIIARGEVPVPLPVEPVGAELASKATELKTEKSANPDPEGRIDRDTKRLIGLETVIVPHTSRVGQSAMAHLQFAPQRGVTWSNEAGPLVVWIDADDIKVSRNLFQISNLKKLESKEPRKVEIEIEGDWRKTARSITGYALYFVCETDGECVYRRLDFSFQLGKEPTGNSR